jgi:DNA-directed RNA polymerase specialized sigma24 family protein
MSKKKSRSSLGGEDNNSELSLLRRTVSLLEMLVRLNLIGVQGNKSQNEMIFTLDSMGCGQSEIAHLLGTTTNTVNVSLYKAKKRGLKK